MTKITRREFMAGISAGASVYLLPQSAWGQSSNSHPFVINIMCGSMDGNTVGLVQPDDVNKYSTGTFFAGSADPSINPNINTHYKSGSLIFNEYSKILFPMARDICLGMGNAQTNNHETGARIRCETDGIGHTAGIVEALSGGGATPVIVGGGPFNTAPAGFKVGNAGGQDANSFASGFRDGRTQKMPSDVTARMQEKLHEVAKRLGKVARISPEQITKYISSNNALVRGMPRLETGGDIRTQVESALNMSKVQAILDDASLPGGKCAEASALKPYLTNYASLLSQFQLAAMLIEGGFGSGMSVYLDGQDMHAGNDNYGSSVTTPRSGAAIFSYVRAFWDWVVSKGYQDNVLICISHEFSRTHYNLTAARGPNVAMQVRDSSGQLSTQNVSSYGTDHHNICGMMFINRRLPPSSRIGGLLNNTAFGSKNLLGQASADIMPYTTLSMLGSVVMRVYPNVFAQPRDVRRIWGAFSDQMVITPLL